ncbi:hypothetical protein [Streptomyces sp. NPDC015131]|uniref:DUF6197 family protein n=1 Tax=Streptomyces sp. NPDC015131 TaxID=3364941 RepID=UPI0036FAE3EC
MNLFGEAARVLADYGFCKGELEDDAGRRCALGALLHAGLGSSALDRYAAADVAAERIAVNLGVDGPHSIPGDSALHPLARWSDAPERTAKDVVLLFTELAHDPALEGS